MGAGRRTDGRHRGSGGGRQLPAHLLAQRPDLLRHAIFDLHPQQHRIVPDQQGRAQQHHGRRDHEHG
ncbi:MAG TPA: hypothetical protein VFR35_06070 [Actinoplanes sp.]|nr:hypothetical protein [Actinoplanes sp.]